MTRGGLDQSGNVLKRNSAASAAFSFGHAPSLDLAGGDTHDLGHSGKPAKLFDYVLCWVIHNPICAIITQIVKSFHCVLRTGLWGATCAK